MNTSKTAESAVLLGQVIDFEPGTHMAVRKKHIIPNLPVNPNLLVNMPNWSLDWQKSWDQGFDRNFAGIPQANFTIQWWAS